MKYEYMVGEIDRDVLPTLNKNGEHGWELCAIHSRPQNPPVFYYRRPIPEPVPDVSVLVEALERIERSGSFYALVARAALETYNQSKTP